MLEREHPTISVELICDLIGRRKLASICKVKPAAVSNWATENVFPPKVFVVVKAECEAAGVPCPEALFNFVQPALQAPDDAA